ncbi:MAG: hypothetical protein ACLPTM_10080 [Steroidobacteraceae bacterium]
MGQTQRLIFLVLAIGWTLFRLLRYARTASAKRPGPAIPPSAGMLPQRPAEVAAAPATVQSPIEPAGSRRHRILAAAGVLIAGNVVIWPLLFATPALADIPPLPRLVAGVLANLILIRLAAGAAARVARRSQPDAADDRNPIK